MISSSEKLLRLLLRQGPGSRADLAKSLKLSRPAVSSLVDGLIRQGILRESGCGASSGGKPPILLTFEPDRFASIGIDVGHESLLRGVLCDAAGKPLEIRETGHGNTFETILDGAARLAKELAEVAGSRRIAGIGAAIAGQVDHDSNEIVYCANFPLQGRNFAALLAEKTNLPVRLENRARTAALWEYHFGAAGNTEDFIFISAERGIGTAIYQGGRLLQGRSGAAGEIRTLRVPSPDGTRLLPIEQALGEKFLVGLAGNSIDAAGLAAAWKRRDPAAVKAVDYLADGTCYVITLLTMLLDPALIVLGGRFRDLGPDFAAELSARLAIEPPRELAVTLSESGRIGAALGAALKLIIENINVI